MFFPIDTTVAMLVVFGYVIFFVIRGIFSSSNSPKVSHEEFMEMYRQMKEDRKEINRYSKWLYDHRPKE